jgi:hypothetical protein
MATRYWTGAVNGGTGTWDASNTANWSTTSGGAGGASVPGVADTAIFDANSGAGVCTLGASVSLASMNITAYTGTLDFSTSTISLVGTSGTVFAGGTGYTLAGGKNVLFTGGGALTRTITGGNPTIGNAINIAITSGTGTATLSGRHGSLDFTGFTGTLGTSSFNVYGNLTLNAVMTVAPTANSIGLFASGTTKTVVTNGVTIDRGLYLDATGSTWTLGDNLTMAAGRQLLAFNGTLNIDGKVLTVGNLNTSYSTARNINFGSGGVLNVLDAGATAFNAVTSTNLTVVGTGTINMTSATAKTFAGGGKAWPTLNQGGAGALTITGANTFANITNTVQPATITFPASTTTVGAFTVSGTSGNQITINSSTPGTRATLSDASGQNSVSFCTIQDINATGGAIWSSFTSGGNVDGGNNAGWDFDASLFRYIYTQRKNKRILPL